tara:strand:+ start:74 stop:271 length:198 start_codon:yes stop_codon:yes gene_type:complete
MKKKSNHLSVISKIENVRKKNNKNWMDILRIAFSHAPDEAAKVLAEIYKEDKKLNNLAKQLTKNI